MTSLYDEGIGGAVVDDDDLWDVGGGCGDSYCHICGADYEDDPDFIEEYDEGSD